MSEQEVEAIRLEAKRQLILERFEKRVSAEKARLKAHRPWWHRVFPFTITIRRRK